MRSRPVYSFPRRNSALLRINPIDSVLLNDSDVTVPADMIHSRTSRITSTIQIHRRDSHPHTVAGPWAPFKHSILLRVSRPETHSKRETLEAKILPSNVEAFSQPRSLRFLYHINPQFATPYSTGPMCARIQDLGPFQRFKQIAPACSTFAIRDSAREASRLPTRLRFGSSRNVELLARCDLGRIRSNHADIRVINPPPERFRPITVELKGNS